jgi:hypothetical protein
LVDLLAPSSVAATIMVDIFGLPSLRHRRLPVGMPTRHQQAGMGEQAKPSNPGQRREGSQTETGPSAFASAAGSGLGGFCFPPGPGVGGVASAFPHSHIRQASLECDSACRWDPPLDCFTAITSLPRSRAVVLGTVRWPGLPNPTIVTLVKRCAIVVKFVSVINIDFTA